MNPTRTTARRLAGDLDAPGKARRFLRQWMRRDPRLHAVTLALSEIVANAVVHGGAGAREGGIEVELSEDGPTVRVTVVHRGPAFEPPAEAPGPGGAMGWGLVRQVVDRWGIEPDGPMVRVWFEVDEGNAGTHRAGSTRPVRARRR